MGRNRIDNNILIQKIEEGKSQKEIAEYFSVSPAAICKRLKRLAPPPESFKNLSEKERAFVIEKVKGNTATQSVMNSYDVTSRESAKVIGSQLLAKPDVQMAIDEIMDYHGLTRSYRVKKLKTHVDNRDPTISLKALEQCWRLGGNYSSPDAGGDTKIFGQVVVNNFHQPVQIVNKPDKNDD